MRVRPISRDLLIVELAERIAATGPDRRLRVAVDGAPAAGGAELADALVTPLRALGRDVLRVSTADFLRPASLRYEFGRTDPDVFYTRWIDLGGLTREVLNPTNPGGSGRVLPALWDAARDRATRLPYTSVPPTGIVLLDGVFLLGGGLPFDLTIHLWLSPAALRRHTAPDQQWTLPAYERYERERTPTQTADIVIRTDDPAHPAIVDDIASPRRPDR